MHGRSFPWREEGFSNYKTIITEILLQRTRAETVAAYLPVFFNKYPDWDALAETTREDLEIILKPLGLYRHRAARMMKIIEEYRERKGHLPRNKNELQESNLSSLYIANAYELFVLNKRAPLLDVNMARVLARYFGFPLAKDVRHDKVLQKLSRKVINVKKCTILNWAFLDFAALVCKSARPMCENCPLRKKCTYFQEVKSELP